MGTFRARSQNTNSRACRSSRIAADAPAFHDDRSDHHRRAAEPAECHRRGNGRGNAPHSLLPDSELVARFFHRADRRTLPAGGAGGPYPGACWGDAMGGEGAGGALPQSGRGRHLSAERSISWWLASARPDHIRAGFCRAVADVLVGGAGAPLRYRRCDAWRLQPGGDRDLARGAAPAADAPDRERCAARRLAGNAGIERSPPA